MAQRLKKDILNHLAGNTGAPLTQRECIDAITRQTSSSLQEAWNQWAGTTNNPRIISECAKILAGLTNQTVNTQDCLELIDPMAAISDVWDLRLWLDATWGVYSDAGTTPAVNGATVQQWDSKIVSATASQGTAASRPQYFSSVANNRPGILFDGTDDFMTFAQITTSNAYIIAYVATNTDGTNGSNILGFAASNAWYIRDNVVTTEGVRSNVATNIGTAVGETNAVHIGMLTSFGTGSASTFINNGAEATSTAATFTTDGINAAAADSPTFLPGGFIHEIIIMQTVSAAGVSAAEMVFYRNYIASYLSRKWGVAIS